MENYKKRLKIEMLNDKEYLINLSEGIETLIEKEKLGDKGYCISLPEGIEIWVRKENFEIFYRTSKEYEKCEENKDCEEHKVVLRKNKTFSEALQELKNGRRIARKGWRCERGNWISLVKNDNYLIFNAPYEEGAYMTENECKGLLPWIGMKTPDDKFVPYFPSQEDLLAEDWEIL